MFPKPDNMRTNRAQFKYALRIAKRNEETARADALARDLYDKDLDEFWSSVRQLNRNSSLLSNNNNNNNNILA